MLLLLCFDLRRRGGIERLSIQVRDSFERQGKTVKVISTRRCGPGQLGRWVGRAAFFLRLIWWLPQAHKVLSMHVLLIKPILWLKPKQLICWLHGLEVWGEAGKANAKYLKSCNSLIASSHFTIEQLPFSTQMAAVVNPMADLINPEQIPNPIPEKLQLLTVARMCKDEDYKGHWLIIQALKRLPDCVSWQVVGDGDQRPELETEVQNHGLEERVFFRGNLSDSELRQAFNNCSVFVMPSYFSIDSTGRATGEGFGIVYLEAALAGRASIACNKGGQVDFISNTDYGWLIPPNVDALENALNEILLNPQELIERGSRARSRALREFNQRSFDAALIKAMSS